MSDGDVSDVDDDDRGSGGVYEWWWWWWWWEWKKHKIHPKPPPELLWWLPQLMSLDMWDSLSEHWTWHWEAGIVKQTPDITQQFGVNVVCVHFYDIPWYVVIYFGPLPHQLKCCTLVLYQWANVCTWCDNLVPHHTNMWCGICGIHGHHTVVCVVYMVTTVWYATFDPPPHQPL